MEWLKTYVFIQHIDFLKNFLEPASILDTKERSLFIFPWG